VYGQPQERIDNGNRDRRAAFTPKRGYPGCHGDIGQSRFALGGTDETDRNANNQGWPGAFAY
jgi:hypothetical protein